MKILEVEKITKSYGKLKVLDNISFSVSEGDYVALIGKNGAGKTTLLNLLLGLANPDSGSIKFFGKQKENSQENIDRNKKFNFKKGKKRFKNRSRPKSFKFKKHHRGRN